MLCVVRVSKGDSPAVVNVIGCKGTQFLHLQLFTFSLPHIMFYKICLGACWRHKADIQFPHLWFSTWVLCVVQVGKSEGYPLANALYGAVCTGCPQGECSEWCRWVGESQKSEASLIAYILKIQLICMMFGTLQEYFVSGQHDPHVCLENLVSSSDGHQFIFSSFFVLSQSFTKLSNSSVSQICQT